MKCSENHASRDCPLKKWDGTGPRTAICASCSEHRHPAKRHVPKAEAKKNSTEIKKTTISTKERGLLASREDEKPNGLVEEPITTFHKRCNS